MDKKTVLITGASRGIGLATARIFQSHGYMVIGTSTSGAHSISKDGFRGYELELSDESSIRMFAEQVKTDFGSIDALINNAGVMIDGRTEGVDIDILRKTLEINLIGPISLTEQLLPIIKDGGAIVNLSSALGSLTQIVAGGPVAYRISKTAINMYTRTLNDRLKGRGIRVYSFSPGWVRTAMGSSNAPRLPEEPAREIYELCESDKESGLFYERGKVREW